MLWSLQPEDPKDPDKIFFRIVLNIDQADNTIHSWEMYDRAGNVFSYTISGFNPSYKAEDSFFAFRCLQISGRRNCRFAIN
jgi:outer membrane lipoprotein-sorting protein